MDESKNLSKVYDPKQVEEHWYSIWEENKYFACFYSFSAPENSIK